MFHSFEFAGFVSQQNIQCIWLWIWCTEGQLVIVRETAVAVPFSGVPWWRDTENYCSARVNSVRIQQLLSKLDDADRVTKLIEHVYDMLVKEYVSKKQIGSNCGREAGLKMLNSANSALCKKLLDLLTTLFWCAPTLSANLDHMNHHDNPTFGS